MVVAGSAIAGGSPVSLSDLDNHHHNNMYLHAQNSNIKNVPSSVNATAPSHLHKNHNVPQVSPNIMENNSKINQSSQHIKSTTNQSSSNKKANRRIGRQESRYTSGNTNFFITI